MTISFECPLCRHRMKVKDELGGRKIKCPSHGGVINVPAAVKDEPTDRASRPAREEPDEDERPRKKKRKKKKGNKGLIIGLVIGGVALVAAVVVLVIVLNRPRPQSNKEEFVEQKPPPRQEPPKQVQPPPEIGTNIRPGSGIRARIDRPERLNELRQIGLYYQQFGGGRRPPSKLEDFLNSMRDAPHIVKAIQEKYYAVRLNVRSGIVAYEYDPDTNNRHGVVDTGAVAQEITTQELLAALKAQGK